MVVAVDKPHIPLRYGTCVRNGRRLALAVVTFLLPLEFPSCINIFQTGHHRAGYIFQDRLTTRRSAGSNDIAISQGNSRARTGLSASTARSLDTRRPSRQSGEHHRPCRTSAENVVEEDGIPVLSDDDLRGLPIRQEIDPGRLTAIEEERHAGPPSSPGTRSTARPWRWRRWRHGALAGVTRVFGRPFRASNHLGPGRTEASSLEVPQDLICDCALQSQSGATRNDIPATIKTDPLASTDKSLLTSPDNHETKAQSMTSGNTGGKATRRRVPIQDGVENWRSRRRSSSIFADAAAVIPPGGTSTAAATVEQTADQRWEESEDEGERPHSSLARTMEYDGERVLEETWAKVNTLRRMAESSGISGKDVATEVVAWWRRGSENEGEGGLTDVDLLRFIMYRHGDVNAAWEQLKQAGRWRKDQRVDQVLSEEKWAAFKAGQAEVFWLARDHGGRPTLVLRSIAHLPGRIETDEFQRYLVYVLEQGRKLWGVGSEVQMNILIDRVGAGLKNQDPRLLGTTLPMFRDAYPDIIYRCYVAPTSWIFRFVWAIGARLVDARQRKRVLLLSQDWKAALLDDFDSSVLPVHLGGTMKDYPPCQPPNM